MAKLRAKHEAFVRLMTESEELARRGFDLLSKRPNPEQFFDVLNQAGLFAPNKNPGPVPGEQEGYIRIPYWSPLDYLVAVARISDERNDLELAMKVMGVVRTVSSWKDVNGKPIANYHTNRKFAEILGLVPTEAVTLDIIALIPVWLQDRYEQGLIGTAIDEGILGRLIDSMSPADWDKAVTIVRQCTTIKWIPTNESVDCAQRPVSAVDDDGLKTLLDHHLKRLATRRARALAELFVGRVHEVFSTEGRREYSHIYRPAIEDHSQNHDSMGAENRVVEGLRDALIALCETKDTDAKVFIQGLLSDESVIIKRIGICVVSKCWAQVKSLYETLLTLKLFDLDYLHELYNLLKEHFAELTPALQQRTLELLLQIPEPEWSDTPARSLKYTQLRWLSAIAEKGCAVADERFAALTAELGPPPEHPDFLSYSELRIGPGPSPYSAQDVIAFLQNGSLIDKLNSFEPGNMWTGPTIDGLLNTIEHAVKSAPELFFPKLSQFLKTKAPYQHAILSGLKQAWENPAISGVEWEEAWASLVSFCESLITPYEAWNQADVSSDAMVPTRNWIISTIAEFLRSGTQSDERSVPTTLLPQTRTIVNNLLVRAGTVHEPSDDAMSEAINSAKGKAFEALISHALRECRAADRAGKSRGNVWAIYAPMFDAELKKCHDGNFEVSTLAGAYLAQFQYMDAGWIDANLPSVFPVTHALNYTCAIDGLAYTPFTREVYQLLTKHGIIDRALRYDLKGHVAREKLLERMAVAYLWKEDELDNGRFAYVFRSDGTRDLEIITRLFGSIKRDEVSGEQRELMVRFWDRSIQWSREITTTPDTVLSALARLAPFLDSADGKERELLEAVAPYVHIDHNVHRFIATLNNLVEVSVDGVNAVLKQLISSRVPDYDYRNEIKSLLERLVEKGKRRDVMIYAETLRNLPGIQELYDRLRATV